MVFKVLFGVCMVSRTEQRKAAAAKLMTEKRPRPLARVIWAGRVIAAMNLHNASRVQMRRRKPLTEMTVACIANTEPRKVGAKR
jgi:hypothetical protein